MRNSNLTVVQVIKKALKMEGIKLPTALQEVPFLKKAESMTNSELMVHIVCIAGNALDKSSNERFYTRLEIVDILARMEYDEEYIESIDKALELMYLFASPKAVLNFFSVIYNTDAMDLKKLPVLLGECTPADYATVFNSIPNMEYGAEMHASSEEVAVKYGIKYKKALAEEKRTKGVSKCKCILRERAESVKEKIAVPVEFDRDGETVRGTLIRGTRDTAYVVAGDEELELDIDTVFVHSRISNAIYNAGEWISQFDNITDSEEPEYEVMWHQGYGKVEVLSKTRDEFGHEVVVIRPMDFNGQFFETPTKYEVDEDEVGEDLRYEFKHEQRPMTCYPCELIPLSSLKADFRAKIEKVFEDPDAEPLYQAYSSAEMVDSSFRRDRVGKVIKGAEKNEETSPVVSGLNEYVHVIACLPRMAVRGDYNRMYHAQLSLYNEAVLKEAKGPDGKYIPEKLKKLKMAPVAKVEVIPTEEPTVVDGVTTYHAKIVDTFHDLKIQKVDKKTNQKTWESKMQTPVVLAVGAETGRMYITPAWWLHSIERPQEMDVVIPTFQQVKDITRFPRDITVSDVLAKSFKKTGEVKAKLNLKTTVIDGKTVPVNQKHWNYFNTIYSMGNAKFRYVDPKTQEVVEAPTNFVHNPSDEELMLFNATAGLITAGRYSPDEQDDSVHIMEAIEVSMAPAAEEVDYKKAIDDVITEIKSLGIANVDYKLTQNKEVPGVIVVEQQGHKFEFSVVMGGNGLEVNTQYKISDKAKGLFVKLIQNLMGSVIA